MVSIRFSAQAVSQVRLAVSCLWEVVAGVRVLRGGRGGTLHGPWANRVRPLLAAPERTLLWRLIPPEPRYLPDFLTPAPTGPAASLETELSALTGTDPEVVRHQLDLAGLDIPELHRDPVAGLHRLAEEITAHWRVALAGDWPHLRALLDAEVHRGARLLAAEGTGALLNDLHETVHWDGEWLTVAKRHCAALDVPDGPGLVLVPSAFVWPSVLTITDGAAPQLAYPARGVAELWTTPPAPPDSLAAVLGRSRARLLAEMTVPTPTTELARRTGMSPGAVSQHLGALRAAGLVTSHRQGKGVLSTRTALGDALLAGAVSEA